MSQTPPLEEVIEAAIGERVENFVTALPAKVTGYSPNGNVVDLEMMITNAFQDPKGENVYQWGRAIGVPVMFPGSGASRITYPINEGDLVLYVVASLPTDSFIGYGQQVGTNVPQEARNNIKSGFAIPGLFSFNRVPTPAATDAMVLHGDIKLGGPDASSYLALKSTLDKFMTILGGVTDPSGACAALHTALALASWPSAWVATKVKGK